MVSAGVAAAITLGTAATTNKALAAGLPDPHQLPVSMDSDGDFLANREEFAIGYLLFDPDQNRNAIPDGIELANRCNSIIENLPWQGQQADPDQTYKWHTPVFGIEFCEICGATINMGPAGIVNPRLNLSVSFPLIALHYIEHGSFSYNGTIHDGRVDVPLLLRVLETRFPYEPNDHQLPLNYVVKGVGQLAPDANDLDGDLLADTEELAAGFDLYDADQDANLVPDGIELAKQCSSVIDQLPVYNPYGGGLPPEETYKINYFQHGLELCEICGNQLNMGYWHIVNPKLKLFIDVYDITCHYLSHGSFSFSGLQLDPPNAPFHNGRVKIALLLSILEMPCRCGDLGTIYLPGDLNKDCKEDLSDLAEFADNWLKSTAP